jgi:tetratricopeptide (TPR) repeat protein
MKQPDWRDFALDDGMLREANADGGRIVVWLPVDRDADHQYWERIANVTRGDIAIDQGLCTTGATSIRARQRVRGFAGKLWSRLLTSNHNRDFPLPNGGSAEQCGDRQNDLILVWSEEQGGSLDETRMQSKWPKAGRIQKLGQNLFLVAGLEPRADGRATAQTQAPSSTGESPRAYAEALLADARRTGAREKESTALTDLGMIQLTEGDAPGAIASLEKALAITREIGDTARESDVIGNLGMAMLAVRQPERARALFEHELAHARATNNRFAEKVALERLGLASSNLRNFSGAIGLFEQALSLARQLGDRHQEANLLWHQGIQHAELGQREPAIAKAEESVALFRTLGRPQANSYGAYLQKYRMGQIDDASAGTAAGATVDRSLQAYLGGSMVASVMAGQSNMESPTNKGTAGPGLLRMAMSATKAMAGFAGSGFKIAPVETQRQRLQTCAACEHHTGVRCKICGCFTNAKSRMLHEACPIGKWPA